MIPMPAELITLLKDQRPHRRWDLWTITLTSGPVIRWTSADIDLEIDGQIYRSQVSITREHLSLTTGLDTSTLQFTVSPDVSAGETTIAGLPMRQAIRAGILAGAKVHLAWGYYDPGLPPVLVGAITRFVGTVGPVDSYASKAVVTVNSPLKRLDLEIPWKAYGAGCHFVLGDGSCGANVSARGVSAAVIEGSNGEILTGLALAGGYLAGGALRVSSGTDAVFWRAIRTNVGGRIYLRTPLPWAPNAGDSILATPGCDLTTGSAGCQRWHGSDYVRRFGGDPYIPSPETAY